MRTEWQRHQDRHLFIVLLTAIMILAVTVFVYKRRLGDDNEQQRIAADTATAVRAVAAAAMRATDFNGMSWSNIYSAVTHANISITSKEPWISIDTSDPEVTVLTCSKEPVVYRQNKQWKVLVFK